VHRDLKPGNVILEGGDPGKAKIIDFGLAKVVAEEGLTRLTEDQQALGSPLYWAPEQSSNREVGPAADVYALGGVAYFALSGVPLFKPAPPVALVYAHANESPEPLATRCRGVELPDGLAELVAACVMKSPASRPSAFEIAGELEEIVGRLSPSVGAGRLPGPVQLHSNQALQGQIRRVLLDIAETIEHPIRDIDRIGSELMDLELELAMLEADSDPRLEGVQAQVAQLQSALDAAYRELHEALTARRASAPPEAAGLYDELDSLLEQYRSL
jgi:serine/threonine protein kinase